MALEELKLKDEVCEQVREQIKRMQSELHSVNSQQHETEQLMDEKLHKQKRLKQQALSKVTQLEQ